MCSNPVIAPSYHVGQSPATAQVSSDRLLSLFLSNPTRRGWISCKGHPHGMGILIEMRRDLVGERIMGLARIAVVAC